jgi:hypothetical protein
MGDGQDLILLPEAYNIQILNVKVQNHFAQTPVLL